jgi:DNA-binding response OmpR family regulator
MARSRVLVVEDEALIAMDLVECLKKHGLRVVGPYAQLDRAIAAASSESIDLAFIDIDLNGQLAYPVADELLSRGIPFAFVTGADQDALPAPYQKHPNVAKPYSSLGIVEAVTSLLSKG